MDRRTVPNIEQRNCKSDFLASASRSYIEISSIAIELNSPVEVMERPDVHDHFTIRGYVAEMRRKDIKKCYPFDEKFGGGNLEDSLPALEVPRFNWWEPEVPQRSGLEMVAVAGGDTNACASENVGTENVGPSSHNEIGNRIDSIDFEDGNNHDQGNAVKDSSTRGTKAQKKLCSKDKKGPSKGIAFQSNNSADNPSVNKDKSASRAQGVDATNANTSGMVQKPKTGRRTPRVDATLANPIDANVPAVAEPQPSGRVHDVAATVSSASEGPSCKRTEKLKLRALDDIIREEKQQRSVNRGNKSASSSRVQTTAAEVERGVSTIPPLQLDVPAHVSKGAKLLPSKRKASHEQGSRNPSMNCPSSSSKRLKGQQVPEVEPIRDSDAPPSSQLGAKSMLLQFRSSVPEQHMEKGPSVSRKRAENEAAVHRPSIIPGISILGNSNNNGNAPQVDLPLSSFPTSEGANSLPTSRRQDRGIPDLNLTIAPNSTHQQGKQLAILPDSGLHPTKNLETPASSSRSHTVGKGAVSEQQPRSKTDNQAEEYPMEIVHLLSEKFHEESITSNARQTKAPSFGPFGVSDRSGVGQSIPMSFSHPPNPPNNQFGMSSWNGPPRQLSLSGPTSQTQPRKIGYTAVTAVTPGPSPSGVSDALWPTSWLNMHLSSSSGAFSGSPYSGKTVSDLKSREERSLNWPSQSSVGGFNPYPKEACNSAMMLLSMMDQRGGSTVKITQPTNVLNRPSSSASSNHPRVLGNENQNYVNGFSFTSNGQTKDFLGLRYGAASVNEKNASQFTRPLPPQQRRSVGIRLGEPSNRAIQPAASTLPLGPCTLNRNPADFSVPDANEYTRTSALISRKKNTGRERPRSLNPAGQKRGRGGHAGPSKQ